MSYTNTLPRPTRGSGCGISLKPLVVMVLITSLMRSSAVGKARQRRSVEFPIAESNELSRLNACFLQWLGQPKGYSSVLVYGAVTVA
jgi:hypothetical protein